MAAKAVRAAVRTRRFGQHRQQQGQEARLPDALDRRRGLALHRGVVGLRRGSPAPRRTRPQGDPAAPGPPRASPASIPRAPAPRARGAPPRPRARRGGPGRRARSHAPPRSDRFSAARITSGSAAPPIGAESRGAHLGIGVREQAIGDDDEVGALRLFEDGQGAQHDRSRRVIEDQRGDQAGAILGLEQIERARAPRSLRSSSAPRSGSRATPDPAAGARRGPRSRRAGAWPGRDRGSDA